MSLVVDPSINYMNPLHYNKVLTKLRKYFNDRKGFIECPTQVNSRILAACEDPSTVSRYHIMGRDLPLPQTGQMMLEEYLMTCADWVDEDLEGLYCVTTSYRNEPNPKPGRHNTIFKLFEFETYGDINVLVNLMTELLAELGFTLNEDGQFPHVKYKDAMEMFNVDELDHEHEEELCNRFGPVVFLTDFPVEHTYWNMKVDPGDRQCSLKIDVLIHGMETFGTAERSTNVAEMREGFETSGNGTYKEKLYEFGKEQVEKEMEEYLSLDFVERCGGGIGLNRLVRGMLLEGLL